MKEACPGGKSEPVDVGRGLEFLVGQEVARGGAQVVAAALGDQIERHPGRDLGDVAAAGRELDLLELVEVEIGGGGPDRGLVGDLDAVEEEVVLLGSDSHGGEGPLHPARAADRDAVHEHSRGLGDERPGVAGAGDGVELHPSHVHAALELAQVEERALGGDADHVLELRRHDDLDRRAAGDADVDPRVLDGREAVELGRAGRSRRGRGAGSGSRPARRTPGPGARRCRSG